MICKRFAKSGTSKLSLIPPGSALKGSHGHGTFTPDFASLEDEKPRSQLSGKAILAAVARPIG
jgi:hypothetical protein